MNGLEKFIRKMLLENNPTIKDISIEKDDCGVNYGKPVVCFKVFLYVDRPSQLHNTQLYDSIYYKILELGKTFGLPISSVHLKKYKE